MPRGSLALLVLATAVSPMGAAAAPTRSSALAVSAAPAGDVVFVVNPDSDSVARLDFDSSHVGRRTREQTVGRYPRTVALAGGYVFTADQKSDTVSQLPLDLSSRASIPLGTGCNPYGVAPTPDGRRLLVTCQGRSELVVLDPVALAVTARTPLPWPNARAIAVSSRGTEAYVTHYLTEEPGTEAHVTVVDLRAAAVAAVFAVPADLSTCETQNSGQGVLNLVSAIALVPDDAPAAVRGQVWIGGTQENNVGKGLFKRYPPFARQRGAGLFPLLTFRPFPEPAPGRGREARRVPFPGPSAARDRYAASLHDITRSGIYKLDALDGHVIGKIDIDQANNATDIEFSPDGTTAYVVDQMFHSYHVFNTRKGQDGDVTTLFAPPSAFGPGGRDPAAACVPDGLVPVTEENPFRIAPQAAITVIDGYDPIDTHFDVVRTGVDFDTRAYAASGVSQMRPVPDGIGTAPIGVRLSPAGGVAYVANYLARNVVPAATAEPIDRPTNLRCTGDPARSCATDNDCPRAHCIPLLLGAPVPSTGADPVPPAVLDGKILFNTAARDSSVPNGMGLPTAAPLFDDPAANGRLPGSVVSTSRTASYVTCSTCHADFGGQDGRTWDFSQFGTSLRNTIDLRGRPSFAPGHCRTAPEVECFYDAACPADGSCRMRDDLIPPNIPAADRDRYFNPMLTLHWNGDRDEVEDFEHTYRSLMGAGDCDGVEEDPERCLGALVQRSGRTSADPVDVHDDLGPPNRNLRGAIDPSRIAGIRLSHVADFVYSLTDFVGNPNPTTAAAARGLRLFNDPETRCSQCHDSRPTSGVQLFTDRRPRRPDEGFDPSRPAGGDRNNPFVRHDVGTANLFDRTDPFRVATATRSFQNADACPPIPASRGVLLEYVTPVLNDVWNSRPYLHDGSAPFLLDVVRPCDTSRDDCLEAGCGRNLDDRHGRTSMLTPQQLNDLTAFQKTLGLDTPVGNGASVVHAGPLRLTWATLAFVDGRGAFKAAGVLGRAAAPIDPQGGVTLSVATPGGEEMVIGSWVLAPERRGRSFTARASEGDTRVRLVLRALGHGRFRFAARGAGAELARLDTGNRDLTVALETSGLAFVRNHNLVGRKRVFRMARRRG